MTEDKKADGPAAATSAKEAPAPPASGGNRADRADANVQAPSPEKVSEEKAGDAPVEGEIKPDNPNEPPAIAGESDAERSDRHIASSELEVERVTDLETQGDSSVAEDAKEKVVKGAAVGPDDAGVVRNDIGRVAYAPPGSRDAADSGVQQDASGHVDSVGTDNTHRSGTRA